MRRVKRKSNEQTDTETVSQELNQESLSGASHPDDKQWKLVKWVSIAAIAGALLCLVVFFQSDIPGKIKQARAQELTNQQMAQIRPVVNKPAETPVGVPSSGTAGESADTPTESTDAPNADIEIGPGAVVSNENLADVLRDMSTDDFIALAESVDMIIADDPARVNLPERKSLAEAYAEAEAKYPGQINASKRLKLVDELNALDYTYYVAEKGDTLLELSKEFGVPLGQLIELNGIHEADLIHAGAILLFPSETVQPE